MSVSLGQHNWGMGEQRAANGEALQLSLIHTFLWAKPSRRLQGLWDSHLEMRTQDPGMFHSLLVAFASHLRGGLVVMETGLGGGVQEVPAGFFPGWEAHAEQAARADWLSQCGGHLVQNDFWLCWVSSFHPHRNVRAHP